MLTTRNHRWPEHRAHHVDNLIDIDPRDCAIDARGPPSA